MASLYIHSIYMYKTVISELLLDKPVILSSSSNCLVDYSIHLVQHWFKIKVHLFLQFPCPLSMMQHISFYKCFLWAVWLDEKYISYFSSGKYSHAHTFMLPKYIQQAPFFSLEIDKSSFIEMGYKKWCLAKFFVGKYIFRLAPAHHRSFPIEMISSMSDWIGLKNSN